MATGIVMPADGFELPHGGDARHDGQIALAADLGRRRAAGIASDPDVRRLDKLQRHAAHCT
jgi:hypothetical protein